MNAPDSSFRVANLRRGDRIKDQILLVEVSNFKQTRNQKYFIQMSLRDSSAAIRAVRWEADEGLFNSFRADDFVRVSGRIEEFQGHPQLIVDDVSRVPTSEMSDYARFLPVSERDVEEMETELHQAIGEVKRPKLRELLLQIVGDPEIRPGLLRCPAGKALHHAYIGGLLEHICSLLGLARLLAQHYPKLDRDVLYAAAILHDIGKVEELSYSGSFQYSDRGQLIGHIAIGMLLLEKNAAKIADFPKDLLLHMQHVIASHHGIPEHGALKLPMTQEAIAFHYLDNIDAKMATLQTIEKELPSGLEQAPDAIGRWSDYKAHMSRRILFPKPDDSQ